MSESETPKPTSGSGSKAPSGPTSSDLSKRLSASAQRRIQQVEEGYTAALKSFEKQCSAAAKRSETTISNATERMSKQIRSTESEVQNLARTMRRRVILPSMITAAVCALIAIGSLYLSWRTAPQAAALSLETRSAEARLEALRDRYKVVRPQGTTGLWIRIEPSSPMTTKNNGTWAKLHGSDQPY